MDLLPNILKGFALGFIQGLTEFLPVSSSGHLLLLERMGVAQPSVTTNLFLHISTLLAVLIVMRKSLFELVKHPLSKKAVWIYVASIPTAVIGMIFKLFLGELLLGKYLSIGFIITAILLLSAKPTKFHPKPLTGALLTGIVQGIAVIPGISRSGSTISAMTAMNYSKEEASELSFLMSIPVIAGGAILEIKDLDFGGMDIAFLTSAFISAFIVGLFSLKIMLKHFNMSRTAFAIYLIALSVVGLII